MTDTVWKKWYDSRPAMIKSLVQQYPWTKYRVKEGAPYSISVPGSVVHLVSYRENGYLRVALLAEDILPEGIEHIKKLIKDHGKKESDFLLDGMPVTGHEIILHPSHLEPIED